MGTNERRRRGIVRILIVLAMIMLAGGYLLYDQVLVVKPRTAQVHFTSAGGRTQRLDLELATTEAQRTKGLMFRHSLPTNGGMLFVFPDEKTRKFWMKETYISLDMIFLGNDLKVVGIVPEVPVLTLEGRGVEKPSRYVVELIAGSAARLGITTDSVMVVEDGLTTADTVTRASAASNKFFHFETARAALPSGARQKQ